MNQKKCRFCKRPLKNQPLLEYVNMPASAQGFPTKEELSKDSGSQLYVCQCPSCGLVQIAGEPVDYYRDVIRATGVSMEMKSFRREQFRDWVSTYGLQGKKVIEIGCGCGEYMHMMAEQPVELYGIEHKPESVKTAADAGLFVQQGYIETADTVLENGPFDGFYSLNFLEHAPEPNRFLQGICNNLTENGVGIVEVPNFNMILEKKLFSEFIADHLVYFTKETLKRVLECSGFEVLEIDEIWYDYIISAVVRKRKEIEIDPLRRQKDFITKQLKEYVENVMQEGGKLAVWGAGHQALAILAMTGISGEITCVIDSAAFKQNKYTPATHIRIVAPEVLKEGDITDVLIIAGGFSDEIAHIMEKSYPDIHRAILRDGGVELC